MKTWNDNLIQKYNNTITNSNSVPNYNIAKGKDTIPWKICNDGWTNWYKWRGDEDEVKGRWRKGKMYIKKIVDKRTEGNV